MNNQPLFTENQRYSPIIWGLVALLLAVFIWTDFQSPEIPLMTVLATPLVLPYFFTKITTSIDEKSIRFRVFPWREKQVVLDEIQSLSIVDCRANIGFFQLFAMRMGTKRGTIYSVGGRHGLFVQLNNGKKFCIGTKKVAELEQLLLTHFNHKNGTK